MTLELTEKGSQALERLEKHFQKQHFHEYTPRSATWVVLVNAGSGVDFRQVDSGQEINSILRTSVIALKRDGFIIDTEDDI